MYCRHCGSKIEKHHKFCERCGTENGRGRSFCSACGSRTEAYQSVCSKCGVELYTNIHREKSNAERWFDNDGPSGMFLLSGLADPVAGFVLHSIFKNRSPRRAKSALKGAVWGIALPFIAVFGGYALVFLLLAILAMLGV